MQRWTPWTIALAAALAALVTLAWREYSTGERAYRRYMALAAQDALDLLADDPLVMYADTQALVRLVAAAAAVGHLESPEALYVLAIQRQRESDWDAAEETLRYVIAARPEWSWPHAALGSLLGRLGVDRLEEAELALLRAIELQPDWSRPHNALAVALRHQGRYAEAEKAALRAIDLAPYDIAAHNNYANLLVVLGRYDEARVHYEYAMDAEPDNAKPPYNLACLFSVNGSVDAALEHLALAIALNDGARRDAAVDPYFDALRELPAFQALVFDVVPGIEVGETTPQ